MRKSMKSLLFVSIIFVYLPINTMDKPKNFISAELIYSDHALKRMAEQNITKGQVELTLRTGYRSWDEEDRGAERFTERKNKKNPLIVVLNRNKQPNVVVTAFIANEKNPYIRPKLTAGRIKEEKYLKQKKENKEKDLQKERNS